MDKNPITRIPPAAIKPEDQEDLERNIEAIRAIFLKVQGEISPGDEAKIHDIAADIVSTKAELLKRRRQDRKN